MNGSTRPEMPWTMDDEHAAIDLAAKKALARRRASGEIMTYHLDGWVVREYPGQRIERLAPIDEYRNEDFPYPGFTPPAQR